MKATITYVGGPNDGNVAVNTWRDPLHGFSVDFPIRQPVSLDPDGESNIQRRVFIEHVIRKAGTNRYFLVEVSGATPEDDDRGEEKDGLVAEAERLGIDVDRRWGINTLRAKVAAARGDA